MKTRLRVIVTGYIAQYPMGGVAWDYLHYVLGLRQLGHDVYYLEDTGLWPFSIAGKAFSRSCRPNVEYLSQIMQRFGLGERWAYHCAPSSRWSGLSASGRNEILRSADLLINVSGSLQRPWRYSRVKRLAYIDSDPAFAQIRLAQDKPDCRKGIEAHDVLFSFGECLSRSDVTAAGYRWRPTRQPVVLSEWPFPTPHRGVWTTVASWKSYKPIRYGGRTFGQKDVEFRRFLELPRLAAPAVLELACAGRMPRARFAGRGWRLVDPNMVCPDLDSYRDYVRSSKAEWSVAKNGYVVGRVGWFSCRSACYLAAGRPVVVQDTGFGRVLPTGEGILPFRTLEQAVAGIREVEAHYERHSKAARAIAEECFDSGKILRRLIDEAMGAPARNAEKSRREPVSHSSRL